MDLHDVGSSNNPGDWNDVTDEIEIQLVIERRINGVRRGDHQKRMTIGGGTCYRLRPEVACSAWSVFNNERLPQSFGQPLPYQACNDVGRTAGRKSNNQTHWPRRIGLRPCDPRDSGSGEAGTGKIQEPTTNELHSFPLEWNDILSYSSYQ